MKTLFGRINWYAVPPALAIVAILIFGAARLVDAAGHVDYRGRVTSKGPIVPGSFHIIARRSFPDGTFVVYTVRRPPGTAELLGAITTQKMFYGEVIQSSDETSAPPVQHHMQLESGHGFPSVMILYGRVVEPHAVAVESRTRDGKRIRAAVQPGNGFILAAPIDAAVRLPLHVVTRRGSQ